MKDNDNSPYFIEKNFSDTENKESEQNLIMIQDGASNNSKKQFEVEENLQEVFVEVESTDEEYQTVNET